MVLERPIGIMSVHEMESFAGHNGRLLIRPVL